MSDQEKDPLHDFTHRSGLRVRVPKCFSLFRHPPDEQVIQIVDGDRRVSFNIALLDDIVAYMKALAWYEGDAMTPASPDWPAFESLLRSKKGIDLKPEWENKKARAQGAYTYNCSCSERPEGWTWDRKTDRWPKAMNILRTHFPRYDRQDTAAYWVQVGADCDCLVAFNVGGELDKGYRRLISDQIRWSERRDGGRSDDRRTEGG
jgi:hypothetical protein